MSGFPLVPGKQLLRAALHGSQPWPIRLHHIRAAVDGGVAACAGAKHLQAQGAAETIKAVAEVEGAGEMAEDHRIEAVGDEQVAAAVEREKERTDKFLLFYIN